MAFCEFNETCKKPFTMDNSKVELNMPQIIFYGFCRAIAGALGNVFTLKMAIKLPTLSQLV